MKKKVIVMVMGMCSCAAPQISSSYQDYDRNRDSALDRGEFISAYQENGYFSKWTRGISVSYTDFLVGLFATLDTDNDTRVSEPEFNAHIKQYFFNMFRGDFMSWDRDGSKLIDKNEFIQSTEQSNLASLWDSSGDRSITEREMAGGMFYLVDKNSNEGVDEIEFNLWMAER